MSIKITTTAQVTSVTSAPTGGPASSGSQYKANVSLSQLVGSRVYGARGAPGATGPAGPQGVTGQQGPPGPPGNRPPIVTLTTDTTLDASSDGYRFNNLGATQPVVTTLPPSATLYPGWTTGFRVVAAQEFTVLTEAGDMLSVGDDLAASFASNKIGSTLDVEYQGGGVFQAVGWNGTWG